MSLESTGPAAVDIAAQGDGVRKKFSAFTLGLFAIVLPNVWAFAATGLVIGIYAGGIPVLVWSSLFVGIILSLLCVSFAEFGSAYPSVAGCVVIASKLGGPKYGRVCGFFTGSLHSLASLITPACLMVSHAPFFTTMAMVMHPDFHPTKWQAFLVAQGVNFIVILICYRGSNFLDSIAIVGSIVLFALFFSAIGVTLGCPDELAPAKVVWFETQNITGWPTGLAFLIGAAAPLSGFGPTHWVLNMAEEAKNPRRSIPIAFLMQQIGSVFTLFIFFIAIGYGVGNEWEAITSSTYAAPIGAVFEIATGSKAATVSFLAVMVTLALVSAASYMSAAVRLVYGFAKTGGLPFSNWLSRYDADLQLPTNAFYTISAATTLLVCVELGNSSAIVTLVGAATLMFTVGYIPIFTAYLLTGGQHLGEKGWFRLPRSASLCLAAFNVVSLVVQSIVFCLPPMNPITLENMNWASAIAGPLLIILLVVYVFYGKNAYQPGDDLIIDGEDASFGVEDDIECSHASPVPSKKES